MKLHVLCDNFASGRGVLAEHGLSLLLEHDGSKIVFDAGQSDIFVRNSVFMGLDLASVNAMVISHGHYDHTGGIAKFCGANSKASIYLQQGCLQKRYRPAKNAANGMVDIGIADNANFKDDIRLRFHYTDVPIRIADGVTLSGKVPRQYNIEADPGDFFIAGEDGLFLPDMFEDEQFMAIEGKSGIFVFIGCAHAGVMNCIEYAKCLFPGKKIAGVVAGMHMKSMLQQRYEVTMEYLRHLSPDVIIPLHCTGIVAMAELKNYFGDRCRLCGAGDSLELE